MVLSTGRYPKHIKMKKVKNIRLELVLSTFTFLTQLQNHLRRITSKKVSFQKLILYFFFKGLSVNLKRKVSFVQEFINNDPNLSLLNDEMISIDPHFDQFHDDISATLGALDEKDKLLQRDLIDQYHLLKAKELRLIQKEEQLTQLEKKYDKFVSEKHELKIQVMIKDAEIEILKTNIEYEKKFASQYQSHEEKLEEENRELRTEHSKQRSTIKDMTKLIKKIERNTNELLRREKSWINQILKVGLPAMASYMGAKNGAKPKGENKEGEQILDKVTNLIQELAPKQE